MAEILKTELLESSEITKVFEFLYYSIIFFVIILFFSTTIDIVVNKIFPQDTGEYILFEIFIMWISLSLMVFISKKFIYMIPNPFTNTMLRKDDFNFLMILVLIPIIISCSVRNMRNKTQYLYDGYEKYFY